MNFTRRHIIQYKPEGVANIFAPTIRINGRTHSYDNTPSPSNYPDFDFSHVPESSTLYQSSVSNNQENAMVDDYNKIFYKLFSQYMDNDSKVETAPEPSTSDMSNQYGINGNNFDGNFAKHLAYIESSNKCAMKGGDCTHKENCDTKDIKGKCSLKDYVCCDSGVVVQPDSRGTQNQQYTSSSYSNSVSGTYSFQGESGTGTGAGEGTAKGTGTGAETGAETGAGGSFQTGVTGNLFKASDEDLLSLYGSEKIGSKIGEKVSYCDKFCGRELRDTKDIKQPDGSFKVKEVDPYYVWRPCTQFCRDKGCPNCGDDDPNDLNKDGIHDASESNKSGDTLIYKNFTTGKARKDNCEENSENCCRELSQTECHKNPNCFYCISEGTQDKKRKCTKIDAQGNYVCDQKNYSACVPLYKQGNNVVPYTEGPFTETAKFNFSKEELLGEKMGDVNVLNYPYLGNCKKPVKETLSLEEQMSLLKSEYSSPYAQPYENPL